MKRSVIVQAITLVTALFLCNSNTTQAKADTISNQDLTPYEVDVSENSIGGMSQLLNSYYEDILSETGISINNAITTIFVDGERLVAKDNTSILFQNVGLANVTDYVNVRASASLDSDVVGRLFSAAVVTIEEIQGEWAKITSNKVSGFVKTEFLYTGDKAFSLAEKTYKKFAKVTCETLNIRSGPGEDYAILSSASQGEELEIVDILEEWVQVKLNSSSSKAYVSKNYVDYVYNFKYAKTLEEIKTDINCMVWPLPSDHNIYSYYGYRVAPTRGASSFHQGLDIGGKKGAKIVAVLAGKVIDTGYSSSGGYYVEIDHGKGIITRYLHNSKILVKVGQYVDQGEEISLVGSTGVSTGPHLHFSLIINGKSVDPYPYLKRVH